MIYDNPITMFRTEPGHGSIDAVSVNEKTVTFINIIPKSGREYKVRLDNSAVKYHTTWEDARRLLINRTENRINNLEAETECEKKNLLLFHEMKIPTEFIDVRTEAVEKKEKKSKIKLKK